MSDLATIWQLIQDAESTHGRHSAASFVVGKYTQLQLPDDVSFVLLPGRLTATPQLMLFGLPVRITESLPPGELRLVGTDGRELQVINVRVP